MTLGEKLKKHRTESGYSQVAFANKIGLSKDLYNKYERDKNRPSYETVILMCKELNITVDYLLEEFNSHVIKANIPTNQSNDDYDIIYKLGGSKKAIDIGDLPKADQAKIIEYYEMLKAKYIKEK